MATFSLNTYTIWKKVLQNDVFVSFLYYKDEEEFVGFCKDSLELVISGMDFGRYLRFKYSDDGQFFHLQNENTIDGKRVYAPSEILDLLQKLPTFTFSVITSRIIPELHLSKEEKRTDWSKTITDLVSSGKVSVIESQNTLATDGRKFWLNNGSETVENAIDVDCLGTSFHRDVSRDIITLWTSIKKLP